MDIKAAQLSSVKIQEKDPVNVTVCIENSGETNENTTLQIYSDQIMIGSTQVYIPIKTIKFVNYKMNTTGFTSGSHIITAKLEPKKGLTIPISEFVTGNLEVLYPTVTAQVQWYNLIGVVTGATIMVALVTLIKKNPNPIKK